MMVDREAIHREDRQLKNRLVKAKLRQDACLEDIDYWQRCGMDRSFITALAPCRWIAEHHNPFINGSTGVGVGKNFFACARSHKAYVKGYSISYKRVPSLLRKMVVARGEGTVTIKK
ncbi:hypothetical protein DFAR_260003 [Desulfarculales bacterium]